MRGIIITPLLLFGAQACVQPATVEERPCPCSPGYRCCEAVQLCMPPEQVAALRCTPPDAGRADAAPVADARPDSAGDLSAPRDAPLPTVAVPPICENGGGGLEGTYFASADFSGPSLSRLEPASIFYWGVTPGQFSPGSWSALFSGQLQAPASETFTFVLGASGGARLWLDGELLIDWWRRPYEHAFTASMKLEADRRYDLLVEYVDQATDPALELRWESPSTPMGPIGQCNLIPGVIKRGPCSAGPEDCIPPGAPACLGQGQGLRVRYYGDRDLVMQQKEQVEPGVSTWISAEDADLPRSMRWEGWLEAPLTGPYQFYLVTSSTAVMSINGRRVVEAGGDTGDRLLHEREGQQELVAGTKYKIQVDQRSVLPDTPPSDVAMAVLVHLRWKTPGGPKSIIPTCFLTPTGPP